MSEDTIIRVIIIILSLIGGFLTLLTVTRTVAIHTLKLETRRLEEASLQRSFNQFNSSLLRALEVLYSIDDYLDSIFQNTKVDRVLMLLATTKDIDFTIVSVIYERHRSDRFELRSRYKRIPVDEAYRKMLHNIELFGKVELDVESMEDCFLRDAYKIEGVTSVSIQYAGKVQTDLSSTGILYFSFGTHDPEKLNKRDFDYINSLFSSVKDVLKVYIKM